jgi:SAM-dependent methyltransferase
VVLPDELRVQREAWDRRPLVRELYRGWYREVVAELSGIAGPTIELGCGIGTFKESHPETVATDVMPTPWTDEVVDAQQLPYEDASVANIVMTDVLHHLSDPMAFLAEAERVLKPEGRVVMVEPFCSPLSTPMWRLFHWETVDVSVDPFTGGAHSGEDPFDANTALPTLIFWRGLETYRRLRPGLPVVQRSRIAWLLYPLSGGLTGRRLLPFAARRGLAAFERALLPVMGRLAAFRCLVTLQRR